MFMSASVSYKVNLLIIKITMKTIRLLIIFSILFNISCTTKVDLFFPLKKWGARYNWKSIEIKDNQLKSKLIRQNSKEFTYYMEKSEFGPKMKDLMTDLHVIDLNNDNLNDIVFDGYSGGEPFEIMFFLNDGNKFRKIFTGYQGITKIEFENKILSKVYMQDWGCCTEYLISNSIYSVNSKNLDFELLSKSKYFIDSDLPNKYFKEPIEFCVKNNNYNLRLNPYIDDNSNSHGYEGQTIKGNIIGKLQMGTDGFALGEKKDSKGRNWWFVAIPSQSKIMNSLFYDSENETSYKLGWISSRFVEIKETR